MNLGVLDWVLGSVTVNTGKTPVITGALVNGVTSVWSNDFRLGNSTSFGCVVVCTGTPQIQVQLEEGFLAFAVNALVQGASNIYYVVPDAFPDIFPLISDTNFHIPAEPLTPIPMTFGRFKVNGLTGNGTTTTVAIGLFRQEPGRFL